MGNLFTGVVEASWSTKASFRNEIDGIGRRLRQAMARRRIYRRTLYELAHSTDRELKDMGIARSEIVRLARDSADQTQPDMECTR